jgi:hypothetical protein
MPRTRAVVAATLLISTVGGGALAAPAALKVPGGLSISEFKGYDAWQAVAVSQTDGAVKLIAANPVMIAAYKAGVPAGGKLFPEGSRIVKIEWAR